MNTFPLRFFGPGLILDPHGQPIALRARKQLALLAYLTTEHAITHSRETLMALLWPEEGTISAQNNLRVTLARVRDLVNKIAADEVGELLLADRYNVRLHPAWVERADVNRFYALLENTRQHNHPSRSQCATCQAALQEAVQLYKGDFLTGFGVDDCPAFEEWLFLQRERLRLSVIDAYHDLALFAENNGDPRVAGSFVQRQIELDPLREPAYRQQMRILAQQGERSLALATFARFRTLLREELGLDPEPETLLLHSQLLNAEVPTPAPSGQSPSAAPSATIKTPTRPRYHLPQQLTPFIGREAELGALQVRLADPSYRLLSIVGPGGIGKSRLAQQVAAQQLPTWRDGVFYVALAQVPTVESIPAAIAETLGHSFVAGQKSPVEQLIELIGPQQILLVLDNFEHLMAGVDLLVDLLQRAPHVVLIVTSRERLNLQAEDLFELQGLPVPSSSADATASTFAAVRLFVDRAHRLDKSFKASAEQLPQIVRLCQLVEGMPLAIELAATWVRELTCQEIVAELATGLDRLETTLRDIDPQHRNLRAVFYSSWRLLAEAERRLLAKLAVFRGGFSSEAVRSICDDSPLLLSALRNKSLLRNAGSRRYDMHALVQQFSAEALSADPASEQRVRQAHSRYFLTLLAEQAQALDTVQARIAGDKIQPDWENITVAWQQAAGQAELPLLLNALDGLVRFCDLRGLFLEAQTLLESTIATVATPFTVTTDEEPRRRLHCRLLTAQAYFSGRRGLEGALGLAQQALTLAEQLNDPTEIISNYIIQAAAYELAADYPQGIQLAEKGLRLAQAAQLERHAGLCLDILGNITLLSSEFGRATSFFEQVLAIHERTGYLEQRARAAIGYLGLIATEQGRFDVALQYNQRYLASCEAVGDHHHTAHAQHYLAYLWLRLGCFEQAIALDTHSAARATRIGDPDLRSFALHAKAWAHRHLGQLAEALICANEAVAVARAYDAPLALAFGLGHLAEVQMSLAQTEADWAAARASFQEAAQILRSIGKLVVAYEAEIGLAELARRRGDLPTALALITPILPHLPTLAADGWDEPIRAYVVCGQILHAVADARAEPLFEQGLQLLTGLAQNISDQTLRRNFLQAIPAHRQLQALQGVTVTL